LGAGAALGTAGAAFGAVGLTAGAVGLAGKGSLGALKAATTLGAGVKTAYGLGQGESSGLAGVAGGLGGIARAGYGVGKEQAGALFRPVSDAAARGKAAAERHLGAQSDGATANAGASSEMPAWARQMQAQQARQRSARRNDATAQAVREGDHPGTPANPSLDEKE
jgi:type IV secretion system protein TrbL